MLYHNVDHTIMVTSVGMQIIRGKHLYEGGFSDLDALNYLVALLCHDVGHKGACRQDDQKKSLFDDGEGGLVQIPATGTCGSSLPIMFQEVRNSSTSTLLKIHFWTSM